ncbi:MAG: sigma-70 family RNA polymerase sigma factor [Caldithrix sp.]|nr:sigma-70 family RNA polymerase sigma factor [Caldithrix sp.]
MEDDRKVIVACKAGDVNRYRYLVDKYKKRAYYTALMFTHNPEDALDLSQEAFYRAYKALNRFDEKGEFYGWFYRILKNVCLNFIRQKNKEKGMVLADNDTLKIDIDDMPDRIFEKNENNRILWAAINHLNKDHKEIIMLKEFNNCSYKEIAESLNIPIGSVMSRLYYARKRLLTLLEGLYD